MTLFFVLAHAAGLALSIWTIVKSGDRPQVLLYAFVVDYLLRLATVYLLTNQARELAPYVSSPPPHAEAPEPLRDEESKRPIGWSGYALVTLALAAFAFVLANVNQDHELDADAATVLDDLGWSIRLAAIYWAESLLARSTIVDPRASREVNLAWNTQEIVVLAFATLTAALVVVFRQTHDLGSSGWAVLGPLLAFRTIVDFNTARRQHAPDA